MSPSLSWQTKTGTIRDAGALPRCCSKYSTKSVSCPQFHLGKWRYLLQNNHRNLVSVSKPLQLPIRVSKKNFLQTVESTILSGQEFSEEKVYPFAITPSDGFATKKIVDLHYSWTRVLVTSHHHHYQSTPFMIQLICEDEGSSDNLRHWQCHDGPWLIRLGFQNKKTEVWCASIGLFCTYSR